MIIEITPDLTQGTASDVEIVGGKLRLKNKPYLQFDGVDDSVRIPVSQSLNTGASTNQITIEVVFRKDDLTDTGGLVSYYDSALGIATEIFSWSNGAQLQGRIRNTDGTDFNVQSGNILQSGVVYYVAMTNDGLLLKLYYTPVPSSALTLIGQVSFTGTIATNRTNLYFGRRYPTESSHWKGNIYMVRIWNVALTQAQLEQQIGKYVDPNSQGLVGYWLFDEGSGTVLNDSSPYANHGTITGATW